MLVAEREFLYFGAPPPAAGELAVRSARTTALQARHVGRAAVSKRAAAPTDIPRRALRDFPVPCLTREGGQWDLVRIHEGSVVGVGFAVAVVVLAVTYFWSIEEDGAGIVVRIRWLLLEYFSGVGTERLAEVFWSGSLIAVAVPVVVGICGSAESEGLDYYLVARLDLELIDAPVAVVVELVTGFGLMGVNVGTAVVAVVTAVLLALGSNIDASDRHVSVFVLVCGNVARGIRVVKGRRFAILVSRQTLGLAWIADFRGALLDKEIVVVAVRATTSDCELGVLVRVGIERRPFAAALSGARIARMVGCTRGVASHGGELAASASIIARKVVRTIGIRTAGGCGVGILHQAVALHVRSVACGGIGFDGRSITGQLFAARDFTGRARQSQVGEGET
jgi:hypothetical protein